MLDLSIDGDQVTLTGTVKGNPEHEALVPPPWTWSRRAGGYVLPRSLLPLTRKQRIRELVAAAQAAGVDLQVLDAGAEPSEADRRQARDQRLEADGTTITYSRANIAKGDEVLYSGDWYPVLRANPKTVTVPSRYSARPGTLPYAKIAGRRPGPTS